MKKCLHPAEEDNFMNTGKGFSVFSMSRKINKEKASDNASLAFLHCDNKFDFMKLKLYDKKYKAKEENLYEHSWRCNEKDE